MVKLEKKRGLGMAKFISLEENKKMVETEGWRWVGMIED